MKTMSRRISKESSTSTGDGKIPYVKSKKKLRKVEKSFYSSPNTLGEFSSSQSSHLDKWYSKVPEEPSEFPSCPSDTVQNLFSEAEKLLTNETSTFEAKCNQNSEKRWMRSVMTKGTIRDKVASYTLMVQEAPMYNLKALESLIGLVKPAKKEAVTCLNVLVELFVSNLLKADCKLKQFSNHPLSLLDDLCSGNPTLRRRRLVAWYFEDKLKTLYSTFIESLQRMVKDTVDSTKEKAIGALGKLLRSNPEQEAVLLSYLVNKLGDPNKKVASKAMYCLTQTLTQHPNMKGVMMDEVEKLLFRPNIGQKARYYGVCFLAQIMFNRNDSHLAAKLIKIYFSFFRVCVKQGNIDSRLLKVLLSGVNRAYPYAREAMDTISEQLETLYKVVHLAPFHIALQALCLLFQVANYKNSVSDRFYSVLYRTLLHPSLAQSSHFAIFLNLFYRALKRDDCAPRVRAFIKRVLQVCCFMPAPLLCGTLFTLSHLMRSRRFVASVTVNTSVKCEEIKTDVATLSSSLNPNDDSEDEHYEDIKLDESDNHNKNDHEVQICSNKSVWNHRKNLERPENHGVKNTDYDPWQRNPSFAHGELCCYSELCVLATHYHPTVALFASRIIKGEFVSYSGDPLKDFTLSRFLERFTFKNPKKQPQPLESSVFAKRQNYVTRGLRAYPITSKAYMNQHEEKIPIDERFLFQFLQQRRSRTENDDDDDIESVGSEEFDDMIDGLMAKRGLKADVDGDLDQEDFKVDFADEYSKHAQTTTKHRRKQEEADNSDASFSDGDDIDDDDHDVEDMEDDDFENDGSVDDLSDSEDEGMEEEEDQLPNKNKQRSTARFDEGNAPKSKKRKLDDIDLDGIDEDIEGLSDYDDMDAIEFEDESDSESFSKKKGKRNDDWESSVFVPTEEFAELLEAASRANQGTSTDLSNRENAGIKQLAWEMDRDRWVKGKNRPDWRMKRTSHFKNRNKPQALKRPHPSKKTSYIKHMQ